MEVNKKLNVAFSVSRVFAVLSIIMAHVGFDNPFFVKKIMSTLGSIGVIVFFILSGYYYKTEKYSSVFSMLKEKAKTIVFPWLTMGTLAFSAQIVSSGYFSITKLLLWLVGYKSYFYYLPVLMGCYLVFYRKNNVTLIISGVLTVISVYATALGVLDNAISTLHLTNYLNVFNWFGFFALGCYMKTINNDKLYKFIKKSTAFTLPIFIILFAGICIFDLKIGYFSLLGIPFELIAALSIFGVSTLTIFNNKIFHTISNMTFSIYLINMPLIWVLKKVITINVITEIVFPIIVVAVASIGFYIAYRLSCRVKLDKLYMNLTGARLSRNIYE